MEKYMAVSEVKQLAFQYTNPFIPSVTSFKDFKRGIKQQLLYKVGEEFHKYLDTLPNEQQEKLVLYDFKFTEVHEDTFLMRLEAKIGIHN